MKRVVCGAVFLWICVGLIFYFSKSGIMFANAALGKTHFIIGYDNKPAHSATGLEKKRGRPKKHIVTIDDEVSTQAFFTSRHDVHSIISSLISQAKQDIKIAAFNITDQLVVQQLKKARDAGVNIAIITDQGNMNLAHSKVKSLVSLSMPVWYYSPALNSNVKQRGFRYVPLMHHKFIIIDDRIVITGSSNLTHAGQKTNMENIVVIRDQKTVKRYIKEFNFLKEKCIACQFSH